MAAAPETIEAPLSISVEGSVGQPPDQSRSGQLHIAEFASVPEPDSRQFVAILATSLNAPPVAEHEALAIQGMLSTVATGSDQHLSELMKQGFREANRAIHKDLKGRGDLDIEGVAMLALFTRGKYATLGLVGPDRAYLMRANRLTQLTRDQRVERARSRRKQDIELQQSQQASSAAVQLLGEQERLDSRAPAIFEITLLPEDRLGLLSKCVLDHFPEERILAALGAGASEGASILTDGVIQNNAGSMLAAVLQVAPSRAAPIYVPAAPARARPWWPVLLLIVVIIAIAASAYLMVL